MRYVNIDLSSDNYLQQPQIFGGFAGEHNETVLQVKLPKRMIDIGCSGYRFDFQTSEDNKIPSPLIPVSELNDGVLSFNLSEQLTVAGRLLFNVVAILSDKDFVSLISKTNTVTLYIGDSPDGNSILPDPNGYKDELQKMIDERIVQINPAFNVEQVYNPTSVNAQSGVALKPIFAEKQDFFATLTQTNADEYTLDLSAKVGNNKIKIKYGHNEYLLFGSNKTTISGTTVELFSTSGQYNFGGSRLGGVRAPSEDTDAATKKYVDDAVTITRQDFNNAEIIELSNNTEYYSSASISTLTITYPSGDFMSSIIFTLANEGNITITLPNTTKYIGGTPNFQNGQTWELNIKNGVLVGGLVE